MAYPLVLDKKGYDAKKAAEDSHAGAKAEMRKQAISTMERVLAKMKTGDVEEVPQACGNYAATEPKGCPGKDDYKGCPGCDRHGGAMARMTPAKKEEPEGTVFDRLQAHLDAMRGEVEEAQAEEG